MYRVGAVLLGAVDRRDRRMVDRREHARLALETGDACGIPGELLREDLDRDLAAELEVPRAVDLAHASGTENADDLVRPSLAPGESVMSYRGRRSAETFPSLVGRPATRAAQSPSHSIPRSARPLNIRVEDFCAERALESPNGRRLAPSRIRIRPRRLPFPPRSRAPCRHRGPGSSRDPRGLRSSDARRRRERLRPAPRGSARDLAARVRPRGSRVRRGPDRRPLLRRPRGPSTTSPPIRSKRRVVVFNAKKGSSLKPEKTAEGVRLRDSFKRLLWLAAARPLPGARRVPGAVTGRRVSEAPRQVRTHPRAAALARLRDPAARRPGRAPALGRARRRPRRPPLRLRRDRRPGRRPRDSQHERVERDAAAPIPLARSALAAADRPRPARPAETALSPDGRGPAALGLRRQRREAHGRRDRWSRRAGPRAPCASTSTRSSTRRRGPTSRSASSACAA